MLKMNSAGLVSRNIIEITLISHMSVYLSIQPDSRRRDIKMRTRLSICSAVV